MMNSLKLTVAAALVAVVGSTGADAQSIARRVAQVRDGTVRMSFASRPEVCGNGRSNITTRSGQRVGTFSREWEDECEHGPVRIAIDVADRQIIAIRAYVGGRWRGGDATDLGMVGVREAVDFLLGDVVRGGGKAAQNAIFPATIADSVTVWPRLLTIARDDDIERGARKQAVFWVGQAAGEKAAEGLREVVGESKLDREVRLSAVFALSQHREGGVPALIDIAKSSKDAEVRKQAIFWLGQSNDKRALDYFEKILTGR
jgi:uncharacterized protein with PIN domain